MRKIKFILSVFVLFFIYSCEKENPITEDPIPTTPVVSIISPTSTEIIGDSVIVQISATDDKGIVKVELFINNQIPTNGTLLIAPFTYVWNIDSLQDSSKHTIYAKAYDADDNVTSTPVKTVIAYKFSPSQLQMNFVGDTSAILHWKDNSLKETGFEIERKINNNNFVLEKTVSANSISTEISGAYLSSDSISFRVRAITANSKSKYSNTASGKVLTPSPSNLSISSLTENSAKLQWKINSSFHNRFVIENSTDGVTFSVRDSVSAFDSSITISGVFITTETYYFRVVAKSNYNSSGYSNIVNKSVVFPQPSHLIVLSAKTDTVVLQWQDNSDFETGFEIYSGTDENQLQLLKTESANSTSAILVSNFTETVKYYFKVRAKSNHNFSDFSNLASQIINVPIIHGMVYVEGGTFQMGSVSSLDNGASPIHTVTLSSFYIKQTEVTQSEWKAVVEWKKNNGGTTLNNDPNITKGDSLPVNAVNWDEVILWITYLNQMLGTTLGTTIYRLPTESQWEFAARGGIKSTDYTYSGSNVINDVSWNYFNSGLVVHNVATKMPNELGIYDMSGNVWEWCSDWHGTYSSSPQTNPTGPINGTQKILRGGSATHDTGSRVTFRGSSNPADRTYTWGFRYVRIN